MIFLYNFLEIKKMKTIDNDLKNTMILKNIPSTMGPCSVFPLSL
ncbi:hypothetical protein EDD55_108104 [Varunaivibrio sulfuroxidans]|uniref:Uncharacterized protein n=1 Tax=Varunaivibrio sulfuroxidans TaxID=1773489 RepID=A0A4R3J7E1_9PROT|nr:hypothetical protein EDD55_108104 [Varunaivibrio sulfuroxidans]